MEIVIQPNPLISVILPIRDTSRFLPACLQSLLFQNYQNIEIIAIDDFSKDNSWQVLKEFKKLDNRLKISRNVKYYGLATTLNRALRKAKGKFIVFMDPRDTITLNKFQKQLDFLIKNPKNVAVGTQCMYLSEEGKRIGKSNFPALHEHISQNPLHGISVLFEGIMVNKYRIPKDLLLFPTIGKHHPFLYSDMVFKLMQYGELANLSEYLQVHRKHTYSDFTASASRMVSLFKLWASSKLKYEEMPSFRSFFSGVLRTGNM